MNEARSRPRTGALAPRPAMWEALDRGPKLRTILEDFYAQVYADPKLAPFFHATTIEWAIDHQYAFIADLLTGERTYFGDRPRNAHHWMVISSELFDYREALLERCLRAHGLADEHVRAWREIDEAFRSHIVKDAPRPRVRRGQVLPLEGYETIPLEMGGLCDGCARVVERNEQVWFHIRTGQAFCVSCATERGAHTSAEGAPA
jgi:truncated hemoglobin YjbI